VKQDRTGLARVDFLLVRAFDKPGKEEFPAVGREGAVEFNRVSAMISSVDIPISPRPLRRATKACPRPFAPA